MVLGGLLTYVFLPTKIETREVAIVKEAKVQVHYVYKKVKKPDGSIEETTQADSSSQSHEAAKDISKKITGYNEKRLLFYGGFNPIERTQWDAGISYNVIGPVDVGVLVVKLDNFGGFINLGMRF